MPRSIWNGTITFGLMRVPVTVHSATEDTGVHFHEVHANDGAQIEHRRICSKEDRAVPYKQKPHKPSRKQLDAAVAVNEALSDEWDPGKYKDRYRDRLRKVVQRKRKGETITAAESDHAPEPAVDLMEALERRLEELQERAGVS